MKHISILVVERAVPAAVVDPRYMFSAVNQFLEDQGKEPFFRIDLVGLRDEVELLDGVMTLRPTERVETLKYTDLIIIPAISGNVPEAIEANKGFRPWILEQHRQGAEVASLCIGAFLLADTGLLEGKECSTHWLFANQFRAMFPGVNLADDKVVTAQDGIYSSGGASSYWNLLLYLVEKYTNREMAVMASKFFQLDIARKSQSPFVMFKGQKHHNDADVLKAQDYIEQHYREKLQVEELAHIFGMGRRTLERRFKKATSNTIVQYIQRVKIEAAKQQLESSHKTVNEVMYDVGYSDTKAFRQVFRKVAAMSPADYRNKYGD